MSYVYYVKYQKKGFLKYISHLDLNLLFRRILLRARIPVELTQGYNPRIKMSFGPALPLGIEGWEEIVEISLLKPLSKEELKNNINNVAPTGFRVIKVEKDSDKKYSLNKMLKYASYLIYLAATDTVDEGKELHYRKIIELSIKSILKQNEIKIIKETKKGIKEVDLRSFIYKIDILPKNKNNEIIIRLILDISSGVSINPRPIINKIMDGVDDGYLVKKVVRENFTDQQRDI